MTDDPELTDLVRRSQAGERDAFSALSERLRPWLSRVATGLTRDPEASQDLVQESLLRAYAALGGYDAARSFTTWIFTILRNLCLNHGRHRRPASLKAPDAGSPESHSGTLDRTVQREVSLRIRDAIERLPAEYREVVVQRYVESADIRSISSRLGISEANVRIRLHRALTRLRESLGEVLS